MLNKSDYTSVLGLKPPWYVSEVSVDHSKNELIVEVSHKSSSTFVCPKCGKQSPLYDHVKKRRWRHLDAWQLTTFIEASIPRVNCSDDGIHQVSIPWSEPNNSFTMLFESSVIQLLQEMNMLAVSRITNLSWDQIDGIRSRAVKRGLSRRKQKPLTHIGIDETSYRKHHEYVTIIHDRATKTVLEVIDHRRQKDLENYLKSLQPEHLESIESVSMDMWDPYIAAIKNCVRDAVSKICFDRFHVAQHFNKAVDKVRAKENKELYKENGYSELKGTKHAWLYNSSKVDNRTRPAFTKLANSSLKTAKAFAIKETASKLWFYTSKTWAMKAWKKLLFWMMRSKLQPVKNVAKTVRKYLWGILNAIVMDVNNSKAESINALIQKVKKQACGFRNRKRFRDAILFHRGGLDLYPKLD